MAQKLTYSPLQIFICSHKPFTPPTQIETRPDIYKIITNCDDPFPPTKLNLLRVSKMECEYGADQNRCLNEWRMINALYYYDKLPEYVGICHYRRYFDNNVIQRLNMRFLDKECEYRAMIGKAFEYPFFKGEEKASEKYYGYWHNIEDFHILREVFQELHPDLMYAFDEMTNADYLYVSAMMILKKDDFYDLCEFIFEMYDALMERYGFKNDDDALKYVTDHRDAYAKPNLPYYDKPEIASRIIGYSLERITNTWLRVKRDNGKSLLEQSGMLEWEMTQE